MRSSFLLSTIVLLGLARCSGEMIGGSPQPTDGGSGGAGGGSAAGPDSSVPVTSTPDGSVVVDPMPTPDAGLAADSGMPSDAGPIVDPVAETRCQKLVDSTSPLKGDPAATPVFTKSIGNTMVGLTEGPIWDAARKRLYFTEPIANRVWSLKPPATLELVNLTTKFGDGMDIVPTTGQLVVGENDQGGIAFYDLPNFTLKKNVLPPLPPKAVVNDVVARADGTVFVTVPQTNSVYRLSPGANQAVLVTDSVPKPNGIGLSPDEKILYVVRDEGPNGTNQLFRFELAKDGTVKVPATLPSFNVKKSPDGVTVDRAGNIYLAHREAKLVEVYTEGGVSLGTITLPGFAFNVAFGGDDYKTLYITAFDKDFKGALYEVKLPIEGCLQ